MGLFDSYYGPQIDAGGGGGSLIDRLLSQLNTQGQYQPSPGFDQPAAQPGQPSLQRMPLTPTERQMMGMMGQDAGAPSSPAMAAPGGGGPVAPPQMQNAPIAVGDSYMMPRVGRGFSLNVEPQEPVSPPAAPQQHQQQQPREIPAFMQSQNTGGLGGAFRGAMANMSSPVGMLMGGIAGGLGMGTGSPQEVQRQAMRVQYQALLDAGIPKEKALLATINPEFGKTIVNEALSNKQKFVQLKDGLGGDHPAFVDETNQTVNGQPIADYNKTQAQTAGAGGLGNMDLQGKEYLASLPKSEANIVQGMAEGTIPPPSSFAMAKPVWTARVAAARNYDPSFDATQWGGRVAGVKDYSSGKSSEMVRSANQTIGHVGDLIAKMDALNNGDYPMKNSVGNWIDTQTGGAATTGFGQTAHAVADELSKVFKGQGISDHEIRQWEESLSPNMSPAQQREAVTTAMSLLNHSLSALEEKRLNSIGPMAAEKAGPLLKPDAQAAVARINKWAAGGGSAPAAAPAAPTGGTAGPRKVNWSVVN